MIHIIKGVIRNIQCHYPKTLRGRSLLISVMMSLLFGLGAAILSFFIFAGNFRLNAIRSAETNLEFMRSDLNRRYESIQELADWCQSNSSIDSFVFSKPSDNTYSVLTREASERLGEKYAETDARAYIARLLISNMEGSRYLARTPQSFYSSDRRIIGEIRGLPYFEESMRQSGTQATMQIRRDDLSGSEEQMLTLIRPIGSKHSEKGEGFLFLQVNLQMLTEPLSQFSRQEGIPVDLQIDGDRWRIEGENVRRIPLVRQTTTLDQSDLTRGGNLAQKILEDGQEMLVVTSPLKADHWSISVPAQVKASSHFREKILLIIVGVFLLALVSAYFLMRSLSSQVSEPVVALKRQLRRIAGGDFSPDPAIEGESEFGEIGHDINLLAGNISSLLEQRIADEKARKDQEYQILQEQINPHFLYNTLNSIKWMALAQHADGIAQMTTALAHLLKIISKGTAGNVSIKAEFAFLDEYFTIQKYRYGGAIDYSYQVDEEELLRVQIPHFTMQPIVENAIFHGIEPKGGSGHIALHLYRQDAKTVRIDVRDDGIGMDEELIQKLLSGDQEEKSGFFRQIGMRNVHQRIQYVFGEEYGLKIESQLGEYTQVSVLLPADESTEEPVEEIAQATTGNKAEDI